MSIHDLREELAEYKERLGRDDMAFHQTISMFQARNDGLVKIIEEYRRKIIELTGEECGEEEFKLMAFRERLAISLQNDLLFERQEHNHALVRLKSAHLDVKYYTEKYESEQKENEEWTALYNEIRKMGTEKERERIEKKYQVIRDKYYDKNYDIDEELSKMTEENKELKKVNQQLNNEIKDLKITVSELTAKVTQLEETVEREEASDPPEQVKVLVSESENVYMSEPITQEVSLELISYKDLIKVEDQRLWNAADTAVVKNLIRITRIDPQETIPYSILVNRLTDAVVGDHYVHRTTMYAIMRRILRYPIQGRGGIVKGIVFKE